MTSLNIVHVVLMTAHGPLSFDDVSSGGRGCTGSEQAMLYLARDQARRGHRVTMYVPTNRGGFAHGIEIIDVRPAWPRLRRLDRADVIISWLSADSLRDLGPRQLKIHSLQINDFMLSASNYDKYVDVFVACSQAHKQHLISAHGSPKDVSKFEVIPNGTDLERLQNTMKTRINRKCVYASSPDRGLHWLLAMWPEIRFEHPDASLHVYYEIQKWLDNAVLLNSEVGNRARFVVRRIEELKRHDGIVHGAVSPLQLSLELLTCDVMLYPADTVRFTEGFGVAVLDACAAGVVPIITDTDAFGEIYRDSGAIIVPRGPDRTWTDRYLDVVLTALKDREDLENRRVRVQEFAQQYDWAVVGQQWEDMIQRRLGDKHGVC